MRRRPITESEPAGIGALGRILLGGLIALVAMDAIASARPPRHGEHGGERLHRQHCATCHGERGDGNGPAAALSPTPADMTGARMVAEMTDSYWFWRVSEGGRGAMPPRKTVRSVDERWAVIAYRHTLSGHRGPHVRAQHPEMGGHARAGHASR